MPKNHAKAIKGMSIACIVLSGIAVLVCLVSIAALAMLGPLMADALYDPYAYGYGYGYGWDDYDSIFGAYGLTASLDQVHGYLDHGYSSYYLEDSYGSLADAQMALTMLNVIFVISLIGQCIGLAAGIIVLKNHNKPEKFGLAFGWSIVGAVVALLSGSIASVVLFIIIAVFVNSDKKLYQAGTYYMPAAAAPGAVPGYPVQQPVMPVAPVAPGAPAVPVAPAAPAPAQPAPHSTQVTTAEIAQPALVPGETQPPAPPEAAATASADAATIVETTQVEAVAVEPAAAPEPAVIPEPDTPVIVDTGAVIKLDIDGDQSAEK